MASSVIHMVVANEINKKLNRDPRKLLIGTIAPDISKLVGGKKSIFVQIISKENEKINAFIQNELDRGSTFFNVQGGYKGDEHRLLEVIVYRREYSRLIDYIHSVDKNAFVISLESKEMTKALSSIE